MAYDTCNVCGTRHGTTACPGPIYPQPGTTYTGDARAVDRSAEIVALLETIVRQLGRIEEKLNEPEAL